MATNYFTLWELLGRSTSQASAAWNVLKTRISLVERLPNTVGKLIGCPQWDQRAVEVTHAKVSGYLDELSANDRVLPKDDPAYPRLLVGLPDAPEFLFVRGDNIDILNRPTIAIVGTRQPSEEGVRRAFKLASLLSSQGMVVASGLARGIDRAAHLGALSVGGSTVAVIGTPLTRVYPPEHWDLQEVIGRFGLVVSQFYPGAGIQRFYFPMRNAVMSGMSLGTVVIEASETSGALIQARQCLKQGRKLFIPQSAIDNPALSWPKTYQRRPGVHVFSTLDDLVEVLASEGLPQVGNLSTHLAPTTEVLRIE
jgi:DNA processing protein